MTNGMIKPRMTTPSQKGMARLPLSSSMAEYFDVFEV